MISAEEIYESLLKTYGTPRWWSEDPFVVMMQAIQVQNTVWSSVEKVTETFADRMTPQQILTMPDEELQNCIRCVGCSKRKEKTMKQVASWWISKGCSRSALPADTEALRVELLSLSGIGAETADCIMVYSFYRPCFIIDAYTRRFLTRLGFSFTDDEERRAFFTKGLPKDARVYGWFHWLLLEHSIDRCRAKPRCANCPLVADCAWGKHEIELDEAADNSG